MYVCVAADDDALKVENNPFSLASGPYSRPTEGAGRLKWLVETMYCWRKFRTYIGSSLDACSKESAEGKAEGERARSHRSVVKRATRCVHSLSAPCTCPNMGSWAQGRHTCRPLTPGGGLDVVIFWTSRHNPAHQKHLHRIPYIRGPYRQQNPTKER